MTVRHASALLFVPLVTLSCEQLDEGSTDCDGTAECALGQVCILPERVCVQEQVNTVVGSFECTLFPPGQDVVELGASDIIVNLPDQRWALTHAMICQVVDDPPRVLMTAWRYGAEKDRFFAMAVTLESVNAGQSTYVDANEGFETDRAAFFAEDPGTGMLAAPLATTIWVTPTQVGQRIRGYVRGGLLPAP